MWATKQIDKLEGGNGLVAVAIDKENKSSKVALKWTVDNILQNGQTVILIHVKQKHPSTLPSTRQTLQAADFGDSELICTEPDQQTKQLFLPFRCFCYRKDIICEDVVLEDSDVARALIEYVTVGAIETLVVGCSPKGGWFRFKTTDIPGSLIKGAHYFCTVYAIAKGKIQSMRSACRHPPYSSPILSQNNNNNNNQIIATITVAIVAVVVANMTVI